MIDKITDTTKVRDWIVSINALIDAFNLKNYSWDTVSEKDVSVYKFDLKTYKQLPVNAEYIVLYAGVELNKSDYKITGGDTLTFTSPTKESGYPIRVRYLRSL